MPPIPPNPGVLASGPMPPPQSPPPGAQSMTGDPMSTIMQIYQNQIQPAESGLMSTAAQTPTGSTPGPARGFGPNIQFQNPIEAGREARMQGKSGVWAGTKAGVHDILQGLLMAGLSTGPGRAMEGAYYGPGVAGAEWQKGQRAQELEGLKAKGGMYGEAADTGAKTAQAIGLAGYKGRMADISQENADTKRMHEQDYKQSIQNRMQLGLAGLDLNKLKAGVVAEFDKFKEKNMVALQDLRDKAINAGITETQMRVDMAAAIANEAAQNKVDLGHTATTLIDRLFDTSLTPPAAQVQVGAQPVAGPKPVPPRAGAGAGQVVPKGTFVWDAQGNRHTSDGTSPLPKGWSLQKAKPKAAVGGR